MNDSVSLISSNFQKTRNDVVHSGRIPSEQDAIGFGDAVLIVIRTALIALRSLEGPEGGFFAKAYAIDMIRRRPKQFEDKQHSTTWIATVTSSVMTTQPDPDFETALKSLFENEIFLKGKQV